MNEWKKIKEWILNEQINEWMNTNETKQRSI